MDILPNSHLRAHSTAKSEQATLPKAVNIVPITPRLRGWWRLGTPVLDHGTPRIQRGGGRLRSPRVQAVVLEIGGVAAGGWSNTGSHTGETHINELWT